MHFLLCHLLLKKMPNSPLAEGLIQTVDLLLGANSGTPSQVNLRRAASSCYYAIFHTVCHNCAESIVGTKGETLTHAWRRAYRALNHNFCKKACYTEHGNPKEVLSKFPEEVQTLAYLFYSMQIKRHNADYDPYYEVDISELETDFEEVKKAIEDFEGIDEKHLKAFATLVLFQDRKDG